MKAIFENFTKAEILDVINSNSNEFKLIRNKIVQNLYICKSQKLLECMDEINIEMEHAVSTKEFFVLLEKANRVSKQFDKLEKDYKQYQVETDMNRRLISED